MGFYLRSLFHEISSTDCIIHVFYFYITDQIPSVMEPFIAITFDEVMNTAILFGA